MPDVTLEQARTLARQGMDKAQQDYGRPICIAIVDAKGFLVTFDRMTGAPVRSIAISQGKAHTAVRMGVPTEAFHARLVREHLVAADFCDPQLTALPGGSPLKDAGGALMGAVGISGLAAAEDQAITDHLAALVAAGTV